MSDLTQVRRTAVMVTALLLLGTGAGGCGESSDPTESSAGPARTQWSRVAHDETVFGGAGEQAMHSVVRGGPGLVAVGKDFAEDGTEGEQGVAAVWTSPDGHTWSRVTHDEAAFGGPGLQTMTSAVAGGPGLVAVGADWWAQVAAVWTSPDGRTWTRAPHDEAVFGGPGQQEMESVTVGGPGLVAVGRDSLVDVVAAMWTSTDGRTWSRVVHDEAMASELSGQEMHSVVAGGPGLVAVGTDWGRGAAAVWTSPDGHTWSRVTHDEEVFGGPSDQEMHSVVAGGPGLAAVGADFGEGAAAVWTSPDGHTWSRVTSNEALLGGRAPQVMHSVVAGGPGLVAVGEDFDHQGAAAAVWTSPDGHTWSRVVHDEAVFGVSGQQTMESVVAGTLGLVAVGKDFDGDKNVTAAVWIDQ